MYVVQDENLHCSAYTLLAGANKTSEWKSNLIILEARLVSHNLVLCHFHPQRFLNVFRRVYRLEFSFLHSKITKLAKSLVRNYNGG